MLVPNQFRINPLLLFLQVYSIKNNLAKQQLFAK